MMAQTSIPTPPVDPDNVEFVIFVRSKKLPQWVPLSIVKGGTTANMLVKSLDNELGKKPEVAGEAFVLLIKRVHVFYILRIIPSEAAVHVVPS